MAYFGGPWEAAFEHAEKFLAGGKNKNDRPVQSNTRLRRVNADTIALVLHTTAVVTYHRDGTFTIYGGGWNTVTTKARISEHSPSRPGSDGHGSWIVGHTGELTPPRVQKCRSCKGRGRWQEEDFCSPGWHAYCQGATTVYDVPFPHPYTQEGARAHRESRREVPCEHGQLERHIAEPCQHGEMTRHSLGYSGRECYRCKGEGRVDYGSAHIPVTVTAGQPYRVDAAGTFLGLTDDIPSTGTYGYAPKNYGKSPANGGGWGLPEPQPHLGGHVADQLAAVIPGMNAEVRHPAAPNGHTMRVREVIVSLNDTHRWTRERIADWLDTLDVDLSFPA